MSSRRYRHSGRHGMAHVDLADRVEHWSREWATPVIQPSSQSQAQEKQSQGATPGNNDPSSDSPKEANGSASTPAGLAKFQVKTWVKIEGAAPGSFAVVDGPEDDSLDILSSEVKAAVTETESKGGLSAADIRGAVGGEAIPGIVSEYKGDDADEDKSDKAPEGTNKENEKLEDKQASGNSDETKSSEPEKPANDGPVETKTSSAQPENEVAASTNEIASEQQESTESQLASEEKKEEGETTGAAESVITAQGDGDVDMEQAPES